MFGPSEGARPGSGCVSMKIAAQPGQCRPRENGRVFALTARRSALATRLLHRSDRDDGHQTSLAWRTQAPMKPLNSGWGSNGFDFSSG